MKLIELPPIALFVLTQTTTDFNATVRCHDSKTVWRGIIAPEARRPRERSLTTNSGKKSQNSSEFSPDRRPERLALLITLVDE
eukprot:6222264-Amphidinium_carterae.1